MEQGYAYIQAHKVYSYITEEELAANYLKADLALVLFLIALVAVFIACTDWLSVPLAL